MSFRVLNRSLTRRLPKVKPFPTTLVKRFEHAGLDNMRILDTRGNGFCGWYMLAFFSQFGPADKRFDVASQIQAEVKMLLEKTCKLKFQDHEMQCLLPAEFAAVYCHYMGFNLAIWTKKRFRPGTSRKPRNSDKWNVDIRSYKKNRPWFFAYFTTEGGGIHWQILVRKTSTPIHQAGRAFIPVFSEEEAQLLFPLPKKRLLVCKTTKMWYQHDFKIRPQDYLLPWSAEDYVGDHKDSSCSDDNCVLHPRQRIWVPDF